MTRLVLALALFPITAFASDLHKVQVWGGWSSCESGYVMRRGECIAESDIPAGPEVIVSDLPSAGEGSRSPRSCPSGGCGSYVTRTTPRVAGPYRTLSGWTYLPPTNPYAGGTLWKPSGPNSSITIQLQPPW
jgi:hypothetical protein